MSNAQPIRPAGVIVRQKPGGCAGRFHTNVHGRQVTWTTDEQATVFDTICKAVDTAFRHGLEPSQFRPEWVWAKQEPA